MPNKELLIQYATNKLKIKELTEENDFISDQVLKEVQAIQDGSDQPVALSELPGCTFTVASRKVWAYSPLVAELEKSFKDRKKLEEQNGDATFTEEPQLRFNTPKSE